MKKSNGKLVRDKIPELVSKAGVGFQSKRLNERDYEHALRMKLIEEATEFHDSSDMAAIA